MEFVEFNLNLEKFTTPSNEWANSGVEFVRLELPPLRDKELDSRFFKFDGSPNETLLARYASVKEASTQILQDPKVKVFVVGGVVAKEDKTGYSRDLDFFIQTKANLALDPNVGQIKQTVGEEGQAREIALVVNKGKIPTNIKDSNFIDIIVSNDKPHEYNSAPTGAMEYFYDLEGRHWYSAKVL
ncbi:MAG: hypothetical protein Q7R44_00910 [bacterium]|nr:hypothetical protein [bacterium]